jgi:hypothetical protein
MASQLYSVVWEYGQRRKFTPVARGLSGGTVSLCWHGETLLVWRNSGGMSLLRCRSVIRASQDHSGGTRWLRERTITYMTWKRVPILMAWGSFCHIKSLRWFSCHWNGIKSLHGAWLLWRHEFPQATSGSNDLGSLQRLEFFPTAWNHSGGLRALWWLGVTLAA